MKNLKILLVIILGVFLSINCADDGNGWYENSQPNKKMKMSFICNEAEKNTDKKHECRFCGKYFHYKSHLLIHERSHTKEKPYICNYEENGAVCGKAYPQITGLNYHKRTFHCKKMKITFICDNINKNSDNKYRCKFCGKYFKDKAYLPIHERSHTREDLYKCNWVDKNNEACNRAYLRQSDLNVHKKSHLKKFSFICDYEDENSEVCGKVFTQESSLRRHLKKMHIKKPS